MSVDPISPDAARWTPEESPGVVPFVSRRDGRFEYATEAIAHVEETSCGLGCRRGARPGSAEWDEVGPGGTCDVLARVCLGDGEPIPELDDRGTEVVCLVREPRARVLGEEVPPVAGQLPLPT